jgi:hypothetical protein
MRPPLPLRAWAILALALGASTFAGPARAQGSDEDPDALPVHPDAPQPDFQPDEPEADRPPPPPPEPGGLVVRPSSVPEEAEVYEPIEVTVEGEKAPPGAVTLGRRQIKEMPGVLGDPYRAIEVEPGVTPVASGIPYYFIRGAPPGNIGYFFDGIQVPLLFHVGAGPGVIPPGLVQRVDLHLGPIPAPFGRFAGAIVDAESVPPRDDWRAEGVMRVVDLGGMVEAPLPDEAGAVLVGGHYAVGAEILSAIVPSVDISYWDYQGRASVKVGGAGRLTVLSFGAYDYLAAIDEDKKDVLLDSDFHRVDVRYEHAFDDGGKVRVATTLGLDRSRGAGVEDVEDFKLGARVMVQHPASKRVLLRAGVDAAVDVFDVTPGGAQECTTFVCDAGPLGGSTEQELAEAFAVLFPDRIDLALSAWADALLVLDERATITPGLRADYYHSLGESELAFDPRLVGRFGVHENVTLVQAVGIASQPAGFPPVPGLVIGGLPGGLQRSLQASSGAEVKLAPIDMRATLFRQVIFNMTDAIGGDRGGGFGAERFLQRSRGDAYGIELSARGAFTEHIFFLASYTLSQTTRSKNGVTVPSAYDRTHVATVALLYDLGKNWRAGVRSVIYSGFPAQEVNPYSELVSDPERVKPFYRLDARVSKRWIFGDRAYVGLVFDMQNVTLSKEVFDVACDPDGCTPREIGPITIPTLAFEAGY